MTGYSATDDLEILFQLIHLQMTAPRVDPLAVERYLDDELPYADGSLDRPGLRRVRRTARRPLRRSALPAADGRLARRRSTADDIERVVRDRFGDASDWSFAFSGDLDVDEMTDLARALSRHAAVERSDRAADVRRAAAAGRRSSTSRPTGGSGIAGERVVPVHGAGHRPIASTTWRRSSCRRSITARLTDVIREELGESYSPYAMVEVGGRSDTERRDRTCRRAPAVELVPDVREAILGELADLGANGPTETEFDCADRDGPPAARPDLQRTDQRRGAERAHRPRRATPTSWTSSTSTPSSTRSTSPPVAIYLAAWLPADQFISVTVTVAQAP